MQNISFDQFVEQHGKYNTVKQYASFLVRHDLLRMMSQYAFVDEKKECNLWSRNFNFSSVDIVDCELLQRYILKCTSEQGIRWIVPLSVIENVSLEK